MGRVSRKVICGSNDLGMASIYDSLNIDPTIPNILTSSDIKTLKKANRLYSSGAW